MADIQSQISDARKAGYDDAAIATHISGMPEYRDKMNTALTAGYKPAEILGFLSTPRATSLVDQIPGMPPVAAPAPAPSLYQRALGAAEVVPGLLSGAVSGVVAPIAGMAGALTSGQFGTQAGVQAGERAMRRTQEAIGYRPVTQPGAENIQAVGEALAPLVGVPIPTLNALARTAGAPLGLATNALRGEAQLVGGAVSDLAKSRAAATQLAREAKSYANAPQIEAAQTAQRLGVALPPSISNPSKTTRVISAIAGGEGDKALGEGNAKQIIKLVKEDIGDTSPNRIGLATIDNALDKASKPYEPVLALPALRVPPALAQTLNNIHKEPSIGGKAGAAAVSSLVDETLLALSKGRSGSMVLGDIRKLRSDAQAIFKANDKGTSAPDPVATDRAKAQMLIANTLEDLIDANAPPEVIPALRAARTKIAQINDHARALDYASGTIDPQMYAKLLQERKGQMTGLPADIGKVAAIYPSVMTVTPAASFIGPRTYRGTLAGGLGAGLGFATGGPVGAVVGGGLGSLGGAFAGNLAARRMASPAFQAKNAVPQDFRRPAPDTGLSLAPGYEPSAFRPREAPPTQAGNQFTLGEYQPPQAPAQLQMPSIDYPGYPKPPVDIVRRYQEGAEAAQIAAEAAGRAPTGRGMALEIGPDGKLRPASQGLVGATPDVIESTDKALQSAISKLIGVPTTTTRTEYSTINRYRKAGPKAGEYLPQQKIRQTTSFGPNENQAFALSAEERIAWNKAKVDLETVVPGFDTLSDKAILGKMQDRQWVTDAVAKARDKAAAFDQIAQRATDAQKMRDAAMSREKLLDLADSLEQRLRGARPVAKATQGPKTREALRERNALRVTPEDNINNLGK